MNPTTKSIWARAIFIACIVNIPFAAQLVWDTYSACHRVTEAIEHWKTTGFYYSPSN